MKRTLPLLIALVIVPAAGADIVPQKSISGVRYGASEAAVLKILGKPAKKETTLNDFGKLHVWTFKEGAMVSFRPDRKNKFRAVQITTKDPTEKTASGVGVGSTEAEVKKGVSKVKCETVVGSRTCHVGTFRAGHVTTDFQIDKGKVSLVTLGLVVD